MSLIMGWSLCNVVKSLEPTRESGPSQPEMASPLSTAVGSGEAPVSSKSGGELTERRDGPQKNATLANRPSS